MTDLALTRLMLSMVKYENDASSMANYVIYFVSKTVVFKSVSHSKRSFTKHSATPSAPSFLTLMLIKLGNLSDEVDESHI